MPTAYVLLNSDLGTDVSIIAEIKQILSDENVEYEVRGVYGVYDIVLKTNFKGHNLKKGDVILFASVGAGMNINALTYQL